MLGEKYVNRYTVAAFILGVLLSAVVKSLVAQLRGHAASAVAA